MNNKKLGLIFDFLLIIILTLLTQIGGLLYLLVIWLWRKKQWKYRKLKMFMLFLLLYLTTTFVVVPFLAPLFGREKIQDTATLQSHLFLTKLLNRDYVRPELHQVLQKISKDFDSLHPGIKTIYLDANFPFWNGFPLLPHLSHHDGKKIDLALIYKTPDGKLTNEKKSRSGYGVFVEPRENEIKQYLICKQKGYGQYDYPKYLTFGRTNKNLKFSPEGTRDLIQCILKQKEIGKIFIEPHLKQRMNLTDKRIRFHGCRAVRHDDHIHIQLE